MMPPPSAAEVHGTNDYLLGFFVGKTAKKSPPKIGEEPNILKVSDSLHMSLMIFDISRSEICIFIVRIW